MKSLPQTIIFPAVLGLLMFSETSMSSAQTTQNSERISQLLSEAKNHALEAENDAATVEDLHALAPELERPWNPA
jgi:hypothetical protein